VFIGINNMPSQIQFTDRASCNNREVAAALQSPTAEMEHHDVAE